MREDIKMRPMRLEARNKRGSGLIETVAGCIIIIPILLFLFDCAAVVIAQTSNDALCKQAARAAAECPTYADQTGPPPVTGGKTAATAIVTAYTNPSFTIAPTCTVTPLPDAATYRDVQVNTKITINLPVPIPLSNINSWSFQAQSVEPVVANFAN